MSVPGLAMVGPRHGCPACGEAGDEVQRCPGCGQPLHPECGQGLDYRRLDPPSRPARASGSAVAGQWACTGCGITADADAEPVQLTDGGPRSAVLDGRGRVPQ